MAPPFTLKGLLSAFSPTGDYFAISSGDGRVKVWDSVSAVVNAEFADMAQDSSGHLALDYTCMAWYHHVAKKAKKNPGKQALSLLILGTGSGDLLAWDTVLGSLKWRTSDCHPGGVKTLAFKNSGGILYSAGVDGMVCELDVTSGSLLGKFRASKRAVSSICISYDECNLLAASLDLKLFDLSNKKRLKKFQGHPDAVKWVLFSEDGKYLLSCACGERQVVVWRNNKTEENGEGEGVSPHVLSMEHPAVFLDCRGGDSDSCLRILAISETGVVYIWYSARFEDIGNVKPIKISVASSKKGLKGSKAGGGVLAAKLVGKAKNGPGSVLVAYGTTVKPLFERLELKETSEDVFLQSTTDGALLPATKSLASKVKQEEETTMMVDDMAIDSIKPRVEVQHANSTAEKLSTKKKRRASDANENSQPIATYAENAAQEEAREAASLDNEETIEEKLRALGLIEDADEGKNGQGDMKKPPRADSLQVLLSQALAANDNSLLEQCLSVSDEKVITNTICKLRPMDASRFLEVSVLKMESRPKRALMLIPWIKAVLLYHASYIMSVPAMQPVLSSLYQVIDTRLSIFRPLLSLSGRLDLIMAQISTTEIHEGDHGVATTVVYDEESEEDFDEEEVEDVMADDDEDEDEDEDDDDDEEDGEDEVVKGSQSKKTAIMASHDSDDDLLSDDDL